MVSTVAAAAARVVNADELAKLNVKPDTRTRPRDESTPSGIPDQSTEGFEPTSDVTSNERSASISESEPLKEHGPVAEEVAEADRVRAELFDENPDQNVEVS